MANSVIFQALINIVLSGALGAVAYFLALVVNNVPRGLPWDEGRNDNDLFRAILLGLFIGGANFAINNIYDRGIRAKRLKQGMRGTRRTSDIYGLFLGRYLTLGFIGFVAVVFGCNHHCIYELDWCRFHKKRVHQAIWL